MGEAWEALDVDHSDIPSFLRPCKRQHRTPTTTTTTTIIDQTISSFSQPIPTPFPPHPSQSYSAHQPSQTLTLHSQQFHSPRPPKPPTATARTTSSSRLIPGPAGAVQAAMLRKSNFSSNTDDQPPVPTQEYIRRAVEDAGEDDDFKGNPWLCALEFVRDHDGMDDDVLSCTPLSDIKKCPFIGKVDKVVAIIKTCTPNGLGDLFVNLKDPTGTLGASIHHKVLSDGGFANDISVGSVLILQRVAIFAPLRTARYLNITLSNVVKVISKDNGPPLRKNFSASTVKYAAPDTDSGGNSRMLQMTFSPEKGRGEAMKETRNSANARESWHIENLMEKGNRRSGGSNYNNGSNIKQNATVELERLSTRQHTAKAISSEAVSMDTADDYQGALHESDKWPKETACDVPGSSRCHSTSVNLTKCRNDKEIHQMDGVQKQRQPLISSVSLPQWTDEQLQELFAGNFEDDIALP